MIILYESKEIIFYTCAYVDTQFKLVLSRGADKALSLSFLWQPLCSRPAVRELVLPKGKLPFVGACGREALNPL